MSNSTIGRKRFMSDAGKPESNVLGGSEVGTVNTFLFSKKEQVCALSSIHSRLTSFFVQSAHGLTENSSTNKRNSTKSWKEKAYFRRN